MLVSLSIRNFVLIDRLTLLPGEEMVRLHVDDQEIQLRRGEFSPWVRLNFLATEKRKKDRELHKLMHEWSEVSDAFRTPSPNSLSRAPAVSSSLSLISIRWGGGVHMSSERLSKKRGGVTEDPLTAVP